MHVLLPFGPDILRGPGPSLLSFSLNTRYNLFYTLKTSTLPSTTLSTPTNSLLNLTHSTYFSSIVKTGQLSRSIREPKSLTPPDDCKS